MQLDGATTRTPAEHRAIIAEAGARRSDVLAWPTAERLARTDPRRLGLLVKWRDLMAPATAAAVVEPGDDSMAAPIYRTDRPSPDEMIAAALRVSFTTYRDRRGRWHQPSNDPRPRMGQLVFHDEDRTDDGPHRGELVEWGRDKHGRPLTPRESLSAGAYGTRSPSASNRWRKALHGAADGAPHGAGAVALIDDPDASHDGEALRGIEARHVRAAIGPLHAEVLDMAISSATAREIGEAFGHGGEYAKKKGVRLANDALDAFGLYLMPEATNDNHFQETQQLAA